MLSIPSDSHLVSTNFELESYLDNLYYKVNALDLEQILKKFIKICLFEEIVLCFMTCVFSFQRQTFTYNYRLQINKTFSLSTL